MALFLNSAALQRLVHALKGVPYLRVVLGDLSLSSVFSIKYLSDSPYTFIFLSPAFKHEGSRQNGKPFCTVVTWVRFQG